MIADATGAELFKIEQKVPYSPNYQLCTDQALADKQANARPELAKLPDSLDIYDEIYLGYPNYWGDLPMAVYTFLEAFDWTGKVIHPLLHSRGQRHERSQRNYSLHLQGRPCHRGSGHPRLRCRRQLRKGTGVACRREREERGKVPLCFPLHSQIGNLALIHLFRVGRFIIALSCPQPCRRG